MDEQRDQLKDEHAGEPTGELADAELEQAAGGIIVDYRRAEGGSIINDFGQADSGIIIDWRQAKG